MKHMAWVWIVSLLVGVYTAFVAMCMWNWFAVPVLNVSKASFLQMLGLIWLIGILINRPSADDYRWKSLFAVMEACLPDDKLQLAHYAMDEQNDKIWIDVMGTVAGQLVGNSLTLGLGYGLHLLI